MAEATRREVPRYLRRGVQAKPVSGVVKTPEKRAPLLMICSLRAPMAAYEAS